MFKRAVPLSIVLVALTSSFVRGQTGICSITNTAVDLGTSENNCFATFGSGGGTVFIGPGSYTHNVPTVLPTTANVWVVGSGPGATVDTCTMTSGDCYRWPPTSQTVVFPPGGISRMTITTASTLQNAITLIEVNDQPGLRFDDLYLSGSFNGTGEPARLIYMNNIANNSGGCCTWSERTYFGHVYFGSAAVGLEFAIGTGGTSSFGYTSFVGSHFGPGGAPNVAFQVDSGADLYHTHFAAISGNIGPGVTFFNINGVVNEDGVASITSEGGGSYTKGTGQWDVRGFQTQPGTPLNSNAVSNLFSTTSAGSHDQVQSNQCGETGWTLATSDVGVPPSLPEACVGLTSAAAGHNELTISDVLGNTPVAVGFRTATGSTAKGNFKYRTEIDANGVYSGSAIILFGPPVTWTNEPSGVRIVANTVDPPGSGSSMLACNSANNGSIWINSATTTAKHHFWLCIWNGTTGTWTGEF